VVHMPSTTLVARSHQTSHTLIRSKGLSILLVGDNDLSHPEIRVEYIRYIRLPNILKLIYMTQLDVNVMLGDYAQ